MVRSASSGYAFVLITVVCFAVYPSLAPVALANGVSPLAFVALTMLVSCTLMVLRAGKSAIELIPPAKERIGFLFLAALFLLEHLCLLFSLRSLDVPAAMAVIYTYPFMIAGISILLGKEQPSIRLAATLLISFAGLLLVLHHPTNAYAPSGIGFAALQALTAAARILLSERIVRQVSPLVFTTRMFAGALILGLPLLLVFPWTVPPMGAGWIPIVVAGISGMIGHLACATALSKISATTVGIALNLEPVIAAILAAVFASQILSPSQYLGALLVVVAVGFYRFAPKFGTLKFGTLPD